MGAPRGNKNAAGKHRKGRKRSHKHSVSSGAKIMLKRLGIAAANRERFAQKSIYYNRIKRRFEY